MVIQELVNLYFSIKLHTTTTKQAYQSVVNTFVNDMGITHLDKINECILIKWRSNILQRATPATWNNYRCHLRAIFNFAVKRNLLATNPILNVEAATVSKKSKKTVDIRPLSHLIDKLNDPENTMIHQGWFWAICIKTLFYTGMRRRQFVGLLWKHIDFEQKTILLVAETSKTKRSWYIPIDDRLYPDLVCLKIRTLEIFDSSLELCQRQVFCLPLFDKRSRFVSNKLTAESLTRKLNRIGKQYGLPLSPHRLRHTLATQIAANMSSSDEVPLGIRALQHQLGHTNLATTLEYVEPKLEQQRKLLRSFLKTI